MAAPDALALLKAAARQIRAALVLLDQVSGASEHSLYIVIDTQCSCSRYLNLCLRTIMDALWWTVGLHTHSREINPFPVEDAEGPEITSSVVLLFIPLSGGNQSSSMGPSTCPLCCYRLTP